MSGGVSHIPSEDLPGASCFRVIPYPHVFQVATHYNQPGALTPRLDDDVLCLRFDVHWLGW
jgi:hypothetical protein